MSVGPTTSPLYNKSVAVTGASGFIGRHLVRALADDHGARVAAFVRSRKRAAFAKGSGIDVREVRLADEQQIAGALYGCEVLFNLAHDFRAPVDQVVDQFRLLVDTAVREKIQRFVQVSSVVVYDNWPNGSLTEDSVSTAHGDGYKVAKRRMETILGEYSTSGALSSVIIQPTIVYGPDGWMWTDRLVEQLLTGVVMLPNDGAGLCPAVYVSDVVDALILAASRDVSGEKFIISAAEPVTWRRYFEAIAGALGRGKISYFDADPGPLFADKTLSFGQGPTSPIRLFVLAIAERLRLALGDENVRRLRRMTACLRGIKGPLVWRPEGNDLALYCSHGHCDISKARALLGYEPKVDFAQGADLTARYIRSRYAR